MTNRMLSSKASCARPG